jgi:ABC-type sulfate transport system substrate-binding protein
VGTITFFVFHVTKLYYKALRIRPLTQQDKSQPRFSHSTDSDVLKTYENTVIIAPHQKSFQFDHVFDSSSTQEQVFNTVASNFVDRFVDGKKKKSFTLIINLSISFL